MSRGAWKNPVDKPEFVEALTESCKDAKGWDEVIRSMRLKGYKESKDTLVHFQRKHKISKSKMRHGGARVSDEGRFYKSISKTTWGIKKEATI